MTDQQVLPQSPEVLAEAKVDSLSELFSRDPLSLRREDRDKIVLALRAQAVRFAQAEVVKSQTKAQPKAHKTAQEALKARVNEEDLF